jgi:hypothetical protein
MRILIGRSKGADDANNKERRNEHYVEDLACKQQTEYRAVPTRAQRQSDWTQAGDSEQGDR